MRELRDAGELSGLPGEGRPLPADPDDEAGEAWAARHVVRTAGAQPVWAELRRDITERRVRIVTRLRGHLAWVARRQELLEQMPSDRILSEVADLIVRESGGALDRDRAETVALALIGMVETVAQRNPGSPPEKRRAAVDTLVALAWRGITELTPALESPTA